VSVAVAVGTMSLEDLVVQVVAVAETMLEALALTTWESQVVLVQQMPLVAVEVVLVWQVQQQ
jgi:hypothetical protein